MWTDNHPTEKEIERLVYPRLRRLGSGLVPGRAPSDYSGLSGGSPRTRSALPSLGIDFDMPGEAG